MILVALISVDIISVLYCILWPVCAVFSGLFLVFGAAAGIRGEPLNGTGQDTTRKAGNHHHPNPRFKFPAAKIARTLNAGNPKNCHFRPHLPRDFGPENPQKICLYFSGRNPGIKDAIKARYKASLERRRRRMMAGNKRGEEERKNRRRWARELPDGPLAGQKLANLAFFVGFWPEKKNVWPEAKIWHIFGIF